MRDSLWNKQPSIDAINQTYELDDTQDTWNDRGEFLLKELKDHITSYKFCSAAIWTQTTDVEGEVNGMMSYDRDIIRPYIDRWADNLNDIYDAAQTAAKIGVAGVKMQRDPGLSAGLDEGFDMGLEGF